MHTYSTNKQQASERTNEQTKTSHASNDPQIRHGLNSIAVYETTHDAGLYQYVPSIGTLLTALHAFRHNLNT